jgi:hypothetical protein
MSDAASPSAARAAEAINSMLPTRRNPSKTVPGSIQMVRALETLARMTTKLPHISQPLLAPARGHDDEGQTHENCYADGVQ